MTLSSAAACITGSTTRLRAKWPRLSAAAYQRPVPGSRSRWPAGSSGCEGSTWRSRQVSPRRSAGRRRCASSVPPTLTRTRPGRRWARCSSTRRTCGPRAARTLLRSWAVVPVLAPTAMLRAAIAVPSATARWPVTAPGVTDDLATVAARFGAALRAAGLPVGPGRSERFAAAVALVRPPNRRDLFNCALATLVSSKDQADILLAVFTDVFGPLEQAGLPAGLPGPRTGPSGPPELQAQAEAVAAVGTRLELLGLAAENEDAAESDEDQQILRPYLGSNVERLAGTDFADLTDAELAQLAASMRKITLSVPNRRSRRRDTRPGGRRTDVRSTLRQARRTGGHAFRLIGEEPALRPRRLVVLCDISGS